MSIPVAIVGLGGYASLHHRFLHQLEQEGLCRVIATCDPHYESFDDLMQKLDFSERGIRLFRGDAEMLEAIGHQKPWVCIAAPVHLHADMHRRAVEKGCPVYLEKPPTLDPIQLEEMIQTERKAAVPTNVGFNFIIQPERMALKERIRSGEFGTLKSVRFFGAWGRPPAYYTRNQWAGRLIGPDGRPLMDSCFGNAMSHFVHQALFWAGTSETSRFASPVEVQAILQRARDIQGADTVMASVKTDTGVDLRFAMTHACPQGTDHWEELILENATLRIQSDSTFEQLDPDGQVTHSTTWPQFEPLIENLKCYSDLIQGRTPAPATHLTECRPFVTLNALLYLSTPGISRFPQEEIEASPHEQGPIPVPKGLRKAQEVFLKEGNWPAEHPPITVNPADLCQLKETLQALCGESG